MNSKKILFEITGSVAGVLWTILVFAIGLTAGLGALIITVIFAPYTWFVKDAELSTNLSWAIKPITWAHEKHSNFWNNLQKNLSKIE
jgi:hypothetical protein